MANHNPYRKITVSIKYAHDLVFIRIGTELCAQLGFKRTDTIEIVKHSEYKWSLKKAPIEFLGCKIPIHYMGRFVCLKARGKYQLEAIFTCRHISLRRLPSGLTIIPHEMEDDCLVIHLGG